MPGFGLQNLAYTGNQATLSADGTPEAKIGGVTLDWNTFAAPGSAGTIPIDGTPYAVGQKFCRIGQVLTKITNPGTDVITLNNTPTGGTFTVTVVVNGVSQTTAGIAYNASAATLQTAIRGLSNVGGTLATVTGSAGGPYTITFDNSLGAVTVTANGAALTGAGAQPTATIVTTAPGGDVGMYGPYDPAATDGRATLTPGEVFVVNQSVLQTGLIPGLPVGATDHPQAIFGGRVFKARLLATTGTHSLAAGPTFTELLAVLPRLVLVEAS